MNILTKNCRFRKCALFFGITILSFGLLAPGQASALGLGDAGSLTLEGLVIGVAILGVIFLMVLGLLLMSKANELRAIEKENQKVHVYSPSPGDIMDLSDEEINELIHDRQMKIKAQS